MTPERYAKLVGHHKAGAYAVATLADVDELRESLARSEARLLAVAEAVWTACRPWGGTGMNDIDLPAIVARVKAEQ